MKKNFKFSIPILAALLFALALAVGGCGGSGGGASSGTSLTSGKSAGQASLTIKWPVRPAGKLIPILSNSIVISVTYNGSIVGTQTVARPTAGGSSTVFFPTLPVGQLGVTATAFPNADGTGTAQASGTGTLAVVASKTATLNINMDSTIAKLVIGSSFTGTLPIDATPGSVTEALTVEAVDATGAMVLISPSKVSWVSSAPTIVSVTADTTDTGATIDALQSGDAIITVTEAESGVSASLAVSVRGPLANLGITAITPTINNGATMQFTIIATDNAGNTIQSPSGLQWSSSSPQVAQINPTKGLCQGLLNTGVTTEQSTTITVAASGLTATSLLSVLPGTATGTFPAPLTVTLNASTQQQFVVYTGTTKANSVVWTIPTIMNLDAGTQVGTIDGNGLYTAPPAANEPTVNGIPVKVIVQGVSGGVTYTSTVTIVSPSG